MTRRTNFVTALGLKFGLSVCLLAGYSCPPAKKGNVPQLANTCINNDDCDPSGATCSPAGFCEMAAGRPVGATCLGNAACASGICIPVSTTKQTCRAAASALDGDCNENSDCTEGIYCSVTDGTALGSCGGIRSTCTGNAACSGGNYCIPTSASEQQCINTPSGQDQACNDYADCSPGLLCTVVTGQGLGTCGGVGATCITNSECGAGSYCIPLAPPSSAQVCINAPSGRGGACNEHADCATGLFCTQNLATTAGICGGVNAACSDNLNCATAYRCIPPDTGTQQTCQLPQAAGGRCNNPEDCTQQNCSPAAAGDPTAMRICGGAGATCTVNADCFSGSATALVCVLSNGTRSCQPRRSVGGGCDDSTDCMPNVACFSDTCGGAADSSGAACTRNTHCVASAACLPPAGVAAPTAGACIAGSSRSRGTLCQESSDCASSTFCSATSPNVGRCGDNGAACTEDNQCLSLRCVPQNASPAGPQACSATASALGGLCSSNADCASNTDCGPQSASTRGTCGGVGAACGTAPERVCNSQGGISCSTASGSGTCGGAGATCSNNSQCASGHYCKPTSASSPTSKTCQSALSVLGGLCDDDADCAPVINSGTALPVRCSISSGAGLVATYTCGGIGAPCSAVETCGPVTTANPVTCVAGSCRVPRQCSDIKSAVPLASNGVYTIDPDGNAAGGLAPFKAYCDMSTDPGGWTLVLNYLHQGGTSPELLLRSTNLPLLSGQQLGANDYGYSCTEVQGLCWGHVSQTLLQKFTIQAIRFYGQTGQHNRIIHFKTTEPNCIKWLQWLQSDTTVASLRCSELKKIGQVGSPTSGYLEHNANLPGTATDFRQNQGEGLLVDHPFFQRGIDPGRNWNVNYNGRWEVDNFDGSNNHTHHQVWIKGP